MADTTPRAQVLTAEEEARWRSYAYEMRAQPDGQKMLRLFATMDAVKESLTAERDAWWAQSDRQVADVNALARRLSASRAETEVVRAREERWRLLIMNCTPGGSEYTTPEACAEYIRGIKGDLGRARIDRHNLRALASELVEGLNEAAELVYRIVAEGDCTNNAPEAAVAVTYWREKVTKARAAGIPPAPEDRTPRVCSKCKTLVRGNDRHACAPEGEKGEG